MSAPCEPAWWIILPAKGAPRGKSRLTGPGLDRTRLSRALAQDTLEAAATVAGAERVVLVSSDSVLIAHARRVGCLSVTDPASGLNGAIRHAYNWIHSAPGRPDHAGAVAVLLADLPALRPHDLHVALAAAAAHPRAFVPDRNGSGSVLLTDRTGRLEPHFGPGSARRHEAAGHVRLDLDLPRLRTDVDLADDLAAAAALGCGRHTADALSVLSPPVR